MYDYKKFSNKQYYHLQPLLMPFTSIQFPEVAKRTRGEENNIFSNTLGETITVEVRPTWQETTQLLVRVLDDNIEVAELLSKEVHRDVVLSNVPLMRTDDIPVDLDISIDDVAIWIDPIGDLEATAFPDTEKILSER